MSQDCNVRTNIGTYALSTTIIKGLDLLEFIGSHQPVQPSAMVKGLGFTRTNVHRFLATFTKTGYVEKTERGYCLTFKVFQLGSSVPISRNLRNVAKPVMLQLEKIAGENIYVNVMAESMIIAIDEVRSTHHLVLNPDVTYSYPINSCASGKTILAFMDREECEALLDELPMEQVSTKTIVDKKQFRSALEEVRQNGYAAEIGEFGEELNSVAAPIFNFRNEIVATISTSGPAMRLTEDRIKELSQPVMEAANRISKLLGRGENQ